VLRHEKDIAIREFLPSWNFV